MSTFIRKTCNFTALKKMTISYLGIRDHHMHTKDCDYLIRPSCFSMLLFGEDVSLQIEDSRAWRLFNLQSTIQLT